MWDTAGTGSEFRAVLSCWAVLRFWSELLCMIFGTLQRACGAAWGESSTSGSRDIPALPRHAVLHCSEQNESLLFWGQSCIWWLSQQVLIQVLMP